MSKVLCTDGLTSKSLAIVRSLGARGIQVIAADKIRWHPSGFSRYCEKTLQYPDPKIEPTLFNDWLIRTIKHEKIDVLFITDDETMEVAMIVRNELAALCKLTMVTEQSYQIAADKGETMKLAMMAGIPCPLTVELQFIEKPIMSELLRLTSEMKYPLVIKPRKSSGARGIRFVNNPQELLEIYTEIHSEYPNPLIQECIPAGTKFDVCVCYDANHQLVASFIQKQIRNYPIGRGPSTVHESVLHPELLNYSIALMNALPWFGVADIEFMIDPRDGKPKLMEINPRFWSSTHLSIRSGVDFPWINYQVAIGADVEIVSNYTIGKVGRSLLPGDILHFLSNPKRSQMNPPFWTTKLPDDIISTSDPLATFGFILSVIRYAMNPKKTWKFLIKR